MCKYRAFIICILTALLLSSQPYAQQKRFSLGIAISDLNQDYAKFLEIENTGGVIVKGVLEGSPSEKAGLKVGDVIIEINGRKIKNSSDFVSYTKTLNPNEEISLSVIRSKGQILKINLKNVEITKLPQVEIAKPINFNFDSSIILVDKSNFEREVLQAEKPVLSYFYAKWCNPCKNFVTSLNEIPKKFGDTFKITAIDVQKSESIVKEYGIGGLLPSVILFNKGNEFDKVIRPSSYSHVENLLTNFINFKENFVEIYPELGKEQGISFVTFIDNSDLFLSKREYKITVWNYKNGNLEKIYHAPISAVSFNGKFIALSGSERVSVKIINILNDSSEELKLDHFIEKLAISGDGKYLASFGKEKDGNYGIKIWDIEEKRNLKYFSVNQKSFLAQPLIAFSPGNSLFVVSGVGNTKLYDTLSWNRVFEPDKSFMEIKFSHDGRYLFGWGTKMHLYNYNIDKFTDIIVDSPIIGFARSNSNYFVGRKGNTFELVDSITKKTIVKFLNYIAPVRVVNTSSDDKIVLSGGSDGVVRMWDIKNGKEIAQFIDFLDGEWVVVTKEGYYNSSKNGHKYLKAKRGKNVYTIDQFYDVFYRPDIVMAKLRGEDISELITVTIDEAIKNPPPTVEIVSFPEKVSQSKATICYKIKSTGGGIGEVRVFHNGKLVYSDGFYRDISKTVAKNKLLAKSGKKIYEEMRGIKVIEKNEISPIQSKSKGELYEDCKEIDVVSGENEITITAFNGQNTVQSFMKTVSFNANIPAYEPSLYVLAIGIDRYRDPNIKLKYAVKDARDIADKIVRQSATLYKEQNIHVEMLTDENATKTNILKKIEDISQKIRPNDSFIFFTAGHGVLLQNQYYMLTHDFSGNINEDSMLSSNEIVEMSKKIKSLSQLFIFDTCHAGGVDYIVSGLYDARMSVLAKKMGLHIYASASSVQEALDGFKGNGLFTYSFLEGLDNNPRADKNRDRLISIAELGEYTKARTIDISRSIGHMQTPLIINFGKDNYLYKLLQ